MLNSAGRTEILRALVYQPKPVGLRQVARIAAVHPHTAELCLATLIDEGLVKCMRHTGRPSFELIRTHEDAPILVAVFTAAATGFIKTRSRTLDGRARSLLPFIKQASRMISRARESRHVA